MSPESLPHAANRVPAPRPVRRMLAGLGLLGVAFSCVDGFGKAGIDAPLVVTQVPAKAQTAPAEWNPKDLVRGDGFDGARLVVVSPEGQVRLLSQGFQSACDPNLSFDGQKLLFAGRKERGTPWRIWEIGLDGQGLRAISPENLDARSPLYVSTLFTLDSPQPWYTAVFVARESTVNEVGRAAGSSLYNIQLDGGVLRRLTFNPNHNLDPFQTWDGRILYAAERYPNEPGVSRARVGLYAIHMEGADMEFFGGAQGRRVQQMPCATGNGLILFVESDEPRWDGAGQLACVEERRPHHTYRPLTKDPAFVYLYPSPLQDNTVLVSRRATDGSGTTGIFRFDADRGVAEVVFDSPDYHDLQAVRAAPRSRPDGHSTVVKTDADSGVFYGMNCYTSDAPRAAHIKRGEVKRVRFIEGVLRTEAESVRPPLESGPYIARRLVGEAPVEADGSFNVEVPADTPLLLQTLDERGMALGNCGWIWVKPKETRGCIGCHEDPELTPENEYVQALRRPSDRLVVPAAERRSITFRTDIAAILQKSCATAKCHGGKDTPLSLPLSAAQPTDEQLLAAYGALMAPASTPAENVPGPKSGKYVDAGRARTSWLVWQILGADTSRGWDKTPARRVKAMPAHAKLPPLSAEDLAVVIQWIDLGAPFEPVKSTVVSALKEGQK